MSDLTKVPSPGKDRVDDCEAIGRGLNFYIVHRLHESGAGSEEGGVADSAGSRDDLTTATEDGFICNDRIKNSEFDVTNGWQYV